MRHHGYTAIPVINREGKYVGTVSEGDFLWQIVSGEQENLRACSMRDLEQLQIRKHFKDKKSHYVPEDEWTIFENTHEPIIDQQTFARVQELRKNKRRPTKIGKTNMFSGIVRCADCGEKLYYCTSRSFEARQDYFVCSTSRNKGKEYCETHFIRAVVLEEGTLRHMQLVISCIANHEEAFRKALGARRNAEARKELASKKRLLQKSENRLAERLSIEVDESRNWATIKRMEMAYHGTRFKWQELRNASNEMGIPPRKIFDANYGTVNSYHADVWRETYAVEII